MRKLLHPQVLACTLILIGVLPTQSLTAPAVNELAYTRKASVVKVHTSTRQGGQGMGTGVVVAPDIVATNCHIMKDAQSVNISKFGDSIRPVSMQADWAHDVCLLKFQFLDLPAAPIRASQSLQYQEEVFSIGFPGGPPKPQTMLGKVRALYPMDGSVIVRTDAAFIMGSSGSPVFDREGRLVAMSTFKSPGRHAYYYSVPTEWILRLLEHPENSSGETAAFWDLAPPQRPAFMQVVQPYLNAEWQMLQTIAQPWSLQSPDSAEATFYLASALHGQGKLTEAQRAYEHCLKLQPAHVEAWRGLMILSQQTTQPELYTRASIQLRQLDEPLWQTLQKEIVE